MSYRLSVLMMALSFLMGSSEASESRTWMYWEESCNTANALKSAVSKRAELEQDSVEVLDFKRRKLAQASSKCNRGFMMIACYEVGAGDVDRAKRAGLEESVLHCSDPETRLGH